MRKLAGHAGKASRSKRGASSHVNTRANKRAAHKYDRTFYEDHHLDPFAYDELPCLMHMEYEPADEETQWVTRCTFTPKGDK